MDIQTNGRYGQVQCPVSERWEESNSGEVYSSVKLLAQEMSNNTKELKNITRWLLLVVCVLALNEKFPQLIESLEKLKNFL